LEDNVIAFGANGILGVGPYVNDCFTSAATTPCALGGGATYYSCTPNPSPTACTAITPASVAEEVQNPVKMFAQDNNGTILELPAIGNSGQMTASGSVVFGIGTRSNNHFASGVTELDGDATPGPSFGFISASMTVNGKMTMLPDSFLDSGSNGIFFNDSSLTICNPPPPSNPPPTSGYYCSTAMYSATLQGTNGTMAAADFSVADALTQFNTGNIAFNNIAGTNPDTTPGLDLGLPFFFGRNIYTGIADPATSAPPYYAY